MKHYIYLFITGLFALCAMFVVLSIPEDAPATKSIENFQISIIFLTLAAITYFLTIKKRNYENN